MLTVSLDNMTITCPHYYVVYFLCILKFKEYINFVVIVENNINIFSEIFTSQFAN